jgi:Glycosyl hydrolases family 16
LPDLRRTFRFLVPLLLFAPSLVGFQMEAQSALPVNYVLQWSDNFAGGALDVTKWNYRTDIKAKSAQLPANVSLDSSGHMNIALRQQHFAGQNFTGGGIISKAAFRYGYFQVKAKTTTNPGWHSSFWMFAGNGVTTYAPGALTEIDDFEIDSSAPDVISMGMLDWSHGKAIASKRCNANYKAGWSTAAGYHTYGLEWTEEEITYYLDGSRICTQPYPPTQYTHDPLNIWLTAIGYSANVAVKDPASPMSFAQVVFYIRDYYIGNGEPGYVEYGSGWQESSSPGYSNIPSRVSCQRGASASYTPTILQSGTYDVEVYESQNADADPAAQLTIQHAGGSTAKTINFANGSTGWVDLGSYPFAVGAGGTLANTNSGAGCTRTSMVKFVRR